MNSIWANIVWLGVNIDFEQVLPEDKNNLTEFMRELRLRLKLLGYIISIDVFPKHNEENDVAQAYDYKELANYADKVILMTYYYHGSWNGAGSIADIRVVEKDLRYALEFIPKQKVYLSISRYGYDWSSKGVENLEFKTANNLVSRYGAKIKWDEATMSPYFTYTDNTGVWHQVWYKNSYSTKYKVKLAEKYDICGLALWKNRGRRQGGLADIQGF